MNSINRALIGLTATMLVSSAALAQSVTYDVAPGQDLSRARSYAFKDVPAIDDTTEHTTAYDSPLVKERTHAAIAAMLDSRGLRRNDNHPDVYVTARRAFKTTTTLYGPSGWGYGYGYGLGGPGYGWGWNGFYPGWYDNGPWYTDEEIRGTLIIDIRDAATDRLLWRGMGEKHVHESSSPEHRTKRVNAEVEKIFEKFPAAAVATSGSEKPVPTDR